MMQLSLGWREARSPTRLLQHSRDLLRYQVFEDHKRFGHRLLTVRSEETVKQLILINVEFNGETIGRPIVQKSQLLDSQSSPREQLAI
jgi:hypothetical protein